MIHLFKTKMSGILYLTANDFILKSGEKGQLMCTTHALQGLCVILFYSNECQHSFNLLTKYKQLPKLINGCQFALININKPSNFNVVKLSQQSISPITFVPDIILYVNGIPYIRYDGPHEIPSIKQFIVDIYQRLQVSTFNESTVPQSKPKPRPPAQNQSNNHQIKENDSSIPAYCIGKPICGDHRDNVSYLTFTTAYSKTL
jgi:hypothetical protein